MQLRQVQCRRLYPQVVLNRGVYLLQQVLQEVFQSLQAPLHQCLVQQHNAHRVQLEQSQ